MIDGSRRTNTTTYHNSQHASHPSHTKGHVPLSDQPRERPARWISPRRRYQPGLQPFGWPFQPSVAVPLGGFGRFQHVSATRSAESAQVNERHATYLEHVRIVQLSFRCHQRRLARLLLGHLPLQLRGAVLCFLMAVAVEEQILRCRKVGNHVISLSFFLSFCLSFFLSFFLSVSLSLSPHRHLQSSARHHVMLPHVFCWEGAVILMV